MLLGSNARDSFRSSSWALARSWPNGFSITTRCQALLWSFLLASPCLRSWATAMSKAAGGTDR